MTTTLNNDWSQCEIIKVSGGPHTGQGVSGILGRSRGTPGWADDIVRQQGGR